MQSTGNQPTLLGLFPHLKYETRLHLLYFLPLESLGFQGPRLLHSPGGLASFPGAPRGGALTLGPEGLCSPERAWLGARLAALLRPTLQGGASPKGSCTGPSGANRQCKMPSKT